MTIVATARYENIRKLAENDVLVLMEKGKTYGDSWKARGGVGAFMMLARKWDRIENICRAVGWDVIGAGLADKGAIMDDIADLRRYLLLVEDEIHRLTSPEQTRPRETEATNPLGMYGMEGGPTAAYVGQSEYRKR